MSKETNAQKKVTAETFRRLAKALRVRARNHKRLSKGWAKLGANYRNEREGQLIRADIYTAIASDCDHEATTLRGMR